MPENRNTPPADTTKLQTEDFEREVLCELIRLHATVLLRMPWVQALLVAGVVVLVFRAVPTSCWGIWGLLTIAMECWRAVYAGQILNQRHPVNPELTHWRLIGLAAVVGATVGLSAVLFLPHMPLPDQALLLMILFAMPAAGVSVAVSSRQILAAYSLLILVPAAISWILLYPAHLITASGLTALYWYFIISVAGDGEQLLRRSVAIRRERDSMLQDLKQRNAEVRAAVTKAELSSRSRARALAAASHDLRQPLHALSVYSAVLVANPSAETLPEVASNIDRLVRNLGRLLHGLLDLSRLSADQYVPDKQRISLDRLADEVCGEYAGQAEAKQLHLVRQLRHVRLYDDQVAISRILRNLLDNAIKYTEQGKIIVKTYCDGKQAILEVEDSGKGIPQEEQSRVFEEFYQLDNPGRDNACGVGLGLAIVQRLCELIGAEIELNSRLGEGTQFKLVLHNLAAETTRPLLPGIETAASLCGRRIYVLDDEADILRAMSLLLHAWGLRVDTLLSVQQTELLFEQAGKPDLLIVDLRLGNGEQGLITANRLREIYGDFPVFVVTGETGAEALQSVRAAGYAVLQKPIIADVLYAAVSSALINQPGV